MCIVCRRCSSAHLFSSVNSNWLIQPDINESCWRCWGTLHKASDLSYFSTVFTQFTQHSKNHLKSMYLLILHCCPESKLPLLLIALVRIQSGKQSPRSDWRKFNRGSFVRKVLEELKSQTGSDNTTQRLAITGNYYHLSPPRLEEPREEVTLLKCQMGKPGRNRRPVGSGFINNGTTRSVCPRELSRSGWHHKGPHG